MEQKVSDESQVAPSWVVVTAVCRHWRAVAFSCPMMWSFLYFPSILPTESLFAKSAAVPLNLWFNFQKDKSCLPLSPYVPLLRILPHMPRVREFAVISDARIPLRILDSLTAPAPFLCSLRLQGRVDDRQPHQHQLHLPKDIFSGVLPNLRRLHLSACWLDWSSPIFSQQLTHLTLDWITDRESDSWVDSDQLFHVLGHMSSLQQLSCTKF